MSLAARFFYLVFLAAEAVAVQQELRQTIQDLVMPIVEDFAMELVDLECKPEGSGMAVRIFIDKSGGVTLDDCVAVSREVEAILEVEDPIRSAYRLEVSSPGLDRPLKKTADFTRFAGRAVKIKTKAMLDPDQRGYQRKTFIGTLCGLEDMMVKVEQTDKKGGIVLIPLDEVAKANLEVEF